MLLNLLVINIDMTDDSPTFTTRSLVEYTQASFGTSNGVTLAKIDFLSQLKVPAFQDGDFSGVASSGRRYIYYI